jgi:hypothetical protein
MAAFWKWAREFLTGQMVGMAGSCVAAAWLGLTFPVLPGARNRLVFV